MIWAMASLGATEAGISLLPIWISSLLVVRSLQVATSPPRFVPPRAALLTGRYQTRFGFEFNPIGAKNAAPGIGLPVEEKTFADALAMPEAMHQSI